MFYTRNSSDPQRHGQGALRGVLLAACLGPLCLLAAVTAQDGQNADFAHSMHESMMRMHAQMDAARTTGNPDRDFASMMIPHHQGAIDMAKVELLYGKDPVMRRLAQEILVDQRSEIDAMQLWLGKTAAQNPKKDK
jgi:uncharacterized protein (DUF305 family)